MISVYTKQVSGSDTDSALYQSRANRASLSQESVDTPINNENADFYAATSPVERVENVQGLSNKSEDGSEFPQQHEWITISYRRPQNKGNSKRQNSHKGSNRKVLTSKAASTSSLEKAPLQKKLATSVSSRPRDSDREFASTELARIFSYLCDLLEHTLDMTWEMGDARYAHDVVSLLYNFHGRFALAARELDDGSVETIERYTPQKSEMSTRASPSASGPTEGSGDNAEVVQSPNPAELVKSYSQATKAHRPGFDSELDVAVALRKKQDQADRNREQYMTDKALRLRSRTNKVESVRHRNQKQQDQLKHYFQTNLHEKQQKAVKNRQERLAQLQLKAKEEQERRRAAQQQAHGVLFNKCADLLGEDVELRQRKQERFKKHVDTATMKEAATERRLAQERERKEKLLNELRKHEELTLKKSRERQDALLAKQALLEEKSRKIENWKLEKELEEKQLRRELHEKIKRAAERYDEHIEFVKGKAAAANEQVNKVVLQHQASKAGASSLPSSPTRHSNTSNGVVVPFAASVTAKIDAPSPDTVSTSVASADKRISEVVAPEQPFTLPELTKSSKKYRAKLNSLCSAYADKHFCGKDNLNCVNSGCPNKSNQKKFNALRKQLQGQLENLVISSIERESVIRSSQTTDEQFEAVSNFTREFTKAAPALEGSVLPLRWLLPTVQLLPLACRSPALSIQVLDVLEQLLCQFGGKNLAKSYMFARQVSSDKMEVSEPIPILLLSDFFCGLLSQCTSSCDSLLLAAARILDVFRALLTTVDSASNSEGSSMVHAWMNYLLSLKVFEQLRSIFLLAHGPYDAELPLYKFLQSANKFLVEFTQRATNSLGGGKGFAPSLREQYASVLSSGEFVGSITMLDAILLYNSGGVSRNAAADSVQPTGALELCLEALSFLNCVGSAEPCILQKALNVSVLQTQLFHFASFWLRYYQQRQETCDHLLEKLTNELILLLGIYCSGNPKGQALLRWGPAPVILQHLVSMPFKYFHKNDCAEVLIPTLIAAVYKDETNNAIMEEELSQSILAQYLIDSQNTKGQTGRLRLNLRVPLDCINDVLKFLGR